MKKNTLLIAVAAAALAVGSGTAFAQGAPQQAGQKSESSATQSNPASKNAPAEKMQGADRHGAANRSETTGQGASQNQNQNQRMGQEQKSPNNRSTTGQAPSERAGQANERSGQANERSGQANERSGQANERQNQRMGNERQNQRENQRTGTERQNNRSTTGQAPGTQQTTPRANEQNRMGGQTNERGGANVNERGERGGANVNERGERGGAGVNERGTAETRGGAAGSVNLTSEQRTKIHSIVVSERNAPRVAHVDFDVRVGTVVPRGKVKFVTLPSQIVEIEPQWRGYEYFMVGDEIVIVDPSTLRIVAVISA